MVTNVYITTNNLEDSIKLSVEASGPSSLRDGYHYQRVLDSIDRNSPRVKVFWVRRNIGGVNECIFDLAFSSLGVRIGSVQMRLERRVIVSSGIWWRWHFPGEGFRKWHGDYGPHSRDWDIAGRSFTFTAQWEPNFPYADINVTVQGADLANSQTRYDVFLSYTRSDQNEAKRLYQEIKTAGGEVFLDEKNLSPGRDFAEEIRKALLASSEVWLLLSPNSVKSHWVLAEWGATWVLKKDTIPLLHRCTPEGLPDPIRRLYCIDFYRYPELIESRTARWALRRQRLDMASHRLTQSL